MVPLLRRHLHRIINFQVYITGMLEKWFIHWAFPIILPHKMKRKTSPTHSHELARMPAMWTCCMNSMRPGQVIPIRPLRPSLQPHREQALNSAFSLRRKVSFPSFKGEGKEKKHLLCGWGHNKQKETNQVGNVIAGDSAGKATKLTIPVFPPTHVIELNSIVTKTKNKARKQKVIGDDSPDLISLYNKQHGSSMPTQELHPLPMLISNRSPGFLQVSSFRL